MFSSEDFYEYLQQADLSTFVHTSSFDSTNFSSAINELVVW